MPAAIVRVRGLPTEDVFGVESIVPGGCLFIGLVKNIRSGKI